MVVSAAKTKNSINRMFDANKVLCIISGLSDRPVGWGGSGGSDEPPTSWKGLLGCLLTNNLTGLKHVSHV